MPELPDLLYIRDHLEGALAGRTIDQVSVKQPVVIRCALNRPFADAITGKRFEGLAVHGPFLRLDLTGHIELVLNLMLAGRLQHQRPGEKTAGYLCFSLLFDDDSRLNLCDEQKMAKAYLVPRGDYAEIPRYSTQGVDILGPEFTLERFEHLAKEHSRKQVRVFINDHMVLSAIGNAYADEILFDARIHPKTFVARLSPEEIKTLYGSIRSVMEWGIAAVREARQPIEVKVRDHMKVRNRKGEPCPRCGATIRREGVRGYDVFFCPNCQRASRRHFIDWSPGSEEL